MADGEQQAKVLKGEEALALARQGKAVWNAWAQDKANAGTKVDFSNFDFSVSPISFAGFVFPGDVYFANCVFKNANFTGAQFRGGDAVFDDAKFLIGIAKFTGAQFSGGNAIFADAVFSGGHAWFSKALFSGGHVMFDRALFTGGDALFDDAQFTGGNVRFLATEFAKEATFSKAKFVHVATFATADFGSAVYLNGTVFSRVPDFRFTKLAAHFSLHGVQVDYCDDDELAPWLGLNWTKAWHEADADKFRRLKELAITSKDHDREQAFFAGELKAKRFYETTGAALVWSYFYEWFSDFGRSTWRPLTALASTWGLFGFGYWLTATFVPVIDPSKSLLDGLRLSAAVLVPFSAAARLSFEEARTHLYGDAGGFWLDMFAFGEGVLGLAFVFLLGLALRNRFRI